MKDSFAMKVVIDFIDTPHLYEKLNAVGSPRKRAMLLRKLAELACLAEAGMAHFSPQLGQLPEELNDAADNSQPGPDTGGNSTTSTDSKLAPHQQHSPVEKLTRSEPNFDLSDDEMVGQLDDFL